MLIFVEGIDKSGKSTFIKNLSQILDINVYRKYLPKDLPDNEFHSFFKGVGFATNELANIFDFDLIVDRSFISDWIYSNRDIKKYAFNIWQEWEDILAKKSLLIYMAISQNTFLQRISLDPDIYMNANEFDKYTNLYLEYLSLTKIPSVIVSGEVSFHDQLDQISSFLLNNDSLKGTHLQQLLS